MKKYVGMCSYYKGIIDNNIIEAESEEQLLRLASRYANKNVKNQHILYVDYISIDINGTESTPLPQEYFAKFDGKKWEYKGTVPQEYVMK